MISWMPRGWLLCLASTVLLAACDREDLNEGSALARGGSTTGPPSTSNCPPPPDLFEFHVLINEVMVENVTTLDDGTGKFPPWIELYNPTDAEVNLGNVALSDDLGKPDKWKVPCIPEAVIPAGGFLIIFADGDQADPDDLHASFQLVPGKRAALVVINEGSDTFAFDGRQLPPDRSVGRFPDGVGDTMVLDEPTPGAANQEPGGPPPPPPPPPGGQFIRGDANSSGTVNVTDLTLVRNAVLDPLTLPPCQDRCDVNDDGLISQADVTFLSDALFLTGSGIPPPYPQAGPDPTSDSLPCP